MAVVATTPKYPRDHTLPYVGHFAISKSDTDELTYVVRGIYVGGAGDLALKMRGDTNAVVYKGRPAGSILPGYFVQVMSTNTTATDIVGVY